MPNVTAGRLRPTTDGVVLIRPPQTDDVRELIAGRDEAFHRWLGPGADEPWPTACIVVDGLTVGWVDYDWDRVWSKTGEINVGYNVFGRHRGRGYATRAVQLLMHHLAVATDVRAATLLISPDNTASLGVARRGRFEPRGEIDGQRYFVRPVPPLSYRDGVVTIRRQSVHDLDKHLDGIDDEQTDWLWLPGQRASWEGMTTTEQRAHVRAVLAHNRDTFETGPKWTFGVDTDNTACVAYVDCDLANDRVPAGEANISYSSHPAHRGKGYVRRAVCLVIDYLRDHTGANEAHIIVDVRNAPSLRVAAAVGAVPSRTWMDDQGCTLLGHIVPV